MSITALHILAKNTYSTAALKGYRFQILETLETWLFNRVHNIEQTSYCDYEEDIYQQDDLTQTAKFSQLKLYYMQIGLLIDTKNEVSHCKTIHKAKGDEFDNFFVTMVAAQETGY